MSTQALAQFDDLKGLIAGFVAPTLEIRVTSLETSQSAIDAGRQVKHYLNQLEKKRKELVEPLNAQVKAINDYAKVIGSPLLTSEQHIKAQIVAFEAEEAKRRAAE